MAGWWLPVTWHCINNKIRNKHNPKCLSLLVPNALKHTHYLTLHEQFRSVMWHTIVEGDSTNLLGVRATFFSLAAKSRDQKCSCPQNAHKREGRSETRSYWNNHANFNEMCCIHHEKVCEVQWKKQTICPNITVKSHLPGATDNRQILLLMAHILWNGIILW